MVSRPLYSRLFGNANIFNLYDSIIYRKLDGKSIVKV